MLIEILPGWSLGLIYIAYFVLITIAVVTGTFVPEVWEKHTVSSFYCSGNNTESIFDNSTCFGSDIGRGGFFFIFFHFAKKKNLNLIKNHSR